jgi:hypothetical protein
MRRRRAKRALIGNRQATQPARQPRSAPARALPGDLAAPMHANRATLGRSVGG